MKPHLDSIVFRPWGVDLLSTEMQVEALSGLSLPDPLILAQCVWHGSFLSCALTLDDWVLTLDDFPYKTNLWHPKNQDAVKIYYQN